MIGLFKLVRNDDGSGRVVSYGSLLPSGRVMLEDKNDPREELYFLTFERFNSLHLQGSGLVLSWIWRIDEADLEFDPRITNGESVREYTKPRG